MGMLLGPRHIYKEPGKPGRPAKVIPPGCQKDKRGAVYNGQGVLLSTSERIKGTYEVRPGTKVISGYAFRDCKNLEEVILPDGVEEICSGAFEHSGVQKVTIPPSVVKIDDCAFMSCPELKTIVLEGDVVRSWGKNVFANSWNVGADDFGRRIVGPLFLGATSDCPIHEIKAEWFPSDVKEIFSQSFFHCENITSIELPEGVTTIQECSFFGCKKLRTLYLPSTLNKIEERAIEGCPDLKIIVPVGKKSYFEQFFPEFEWNKIAEVR